jgi:prolyl oligopeptidase
VKPIIRGIDAEFAVALGGDNLFIRTDWDAPKGRVIAIDFCSGTPGYWTEIIPECEDVIQSISPVGGRLFVSYTHNVVPAIKVFEPDGKLVRTVDLPSAGWLGEISGRWDGADAFFYFSSYHIPPRIYRHSVRAGGRNIWWQSGVPVDSDLFDVRQVWYKSKDGTGVPMFVASRKDAALDGSNPTLLEGYGGFRSVAMPHFSAQVALWIKHGGVYAYPGLRGGSEFGEAWHRAGMLDKKQNTFDDFIAAAEYLIGEGYTTPQRLAMSGGSNGGLLVGAAMTQRPDLFQAVVCWHPLLDMIRYHRFLVGSFWVPEYGSSDARRQFEYLYAYSPYHRVVEGTAYPAMLMVSGDADTRVDPMHARKMVARLQAASSSARPILLRYDTKAGHMGGKPLAKVIEEDADEMRFLMWQLGMIW